MVEVIWYPPTRWRVGEAICTSTIPWDVGTDFAVGVGITEGDDWRAKELRWQAKVLRAPIVLRLFDDNTWVRLVGVRGGKPVEEVRLFAPPPIAHPLNVRFGDKLLLLGYDAYPGPGQRLRPGDALRITLYWQALGPMERSYTVFVHLYDSAGNLLAQKDSIPRQGSYPTFWWLPGEVVADSYALTVPKTAQSDKALLTVGMYLPESGARLPAFDYEGNALDDVVKLGEYLLK